MIKRILLLLALAAFFNSRALADHIQVCGDVSGVWSADTVNVVCDIRLPAYDTLAIDPGTVVLFQAYFRFSIETGAVLRAIGNESNYILFDERYSGNGWHGLHFSSSSDSSRLEYCIIRHGSSSGQGDDFNGGGINIMQTNLTLSNCIFDSCNASNGGAIYSYNGSAPTVINCTLRYCSAMLGGAIFALNSSPIIKYCNFRQNSGSDGGGINLTGSNATVDSNYFISNSSNSGGAISCEYGSNAFVRYNMFDSNSAWWWSAGGINCSTNSNATIRENTLTNNSPGGISASDCNATIRLNVIRNNPGAGIILTNYSGRVMENTIISNTQGIAASGGNPLILRNIAIGNSNSSNGGGMSFIDCNPKIKGNIIAHNTANLGGGIYLERASADTIFNNTITDNTALQYGGAIYCNSSNPVIQNSILFGNISQDMSQVHPVNGSTPNISYCDIQGGWFGEANIDAPPRFRDPANNDYHVQSLSNPACGGPSDSPCIDAGNPAIADDTISCEWGLGSQRCDMGGYGGGALPTGIFADSDVPRDYWLLSNYPNPFNAQTSIAFFMPAGGNIELSIYDILGRSVAAPINAYLQPGPHLIVWDAPNASSGIYLARLLVGESAQSIKMHLVK